MPSRGTESIKKGGREGCLTWMGLHKIVHLPNSAILCIFQKLCSSIKIFWTSYTHSHTDIHIFLRREIFGGFSYKRHCALWWISNIINITFIFNIACFFSGLLFTLVLQESHQSILWWLVWFKLRLNSQNLEEAITRLILFRNNLSLSKVFWPCFQDGLSW